MLCRPSTPHSPWFLGVSPVLTSGRTRTLTITFPLVSFPFELVLPAPAASSVSSNVVALVEQDPWADELRLWGGEASPSRASELRMDFPSTLPLSKEGVFELR